jgi:hypothetical protein
MANTHNKTPTKKTKLVRDSFTIPKAEFMVIEDMKTRAIALGTSVKKSELLRAGLKLLQNLNDSDYKAALAAVPTLKTGRPSSEEPSDETPKIIQVPATPKTVTAKTAVKAAPKVSAKPATQAARKSVVQPAVKQPAKRAPATRTAVTKAPVATKAAKPVASTKSVIKSTPASKVAMPVEEVKPALQASAAETPAKTKA